MRNVLILVLVGVMTMAAWAGDAAPPREVQSAAAKCEEATKQAQDVYRKAIAAAKTAYLKEVREQLAAAMKAEKVDLVKSLDALREELEGDIRFLGGKGGVVKVSAKEWTKVMLVKKGQKYKFEARGKWRMGPDLPECDAEGVGSFRGKPSNVGLLLGRVGAQTFTIGRSKTITVQQDGELEMGPTDSILADNAGELTVLVQGIPES